MPGKYNITILQGSTFGVTVDWKDSAGVQVPLLGYTAQMQIRYINANGAVAADLTTENGGIVIDTVANTIKINLSAEQTAGLKVLGCVYDLEMIKDGTVTRLLEGKVKISPEVTK